MGVARKGLSYIPMRVTVFLLGAKDRDAGVKGSAGLSDPVCCRSVVLVSSLVSRFLWVWLPRLCPPSLWFKCLVSQTMVQFCWLYILLAWPHPHLVQLITVWIELISWGTILNTLLKKMYIWFLSVACSEIVHWIKRYINVSINQLVVLQDFGWNQQIVLVVLRGLLAFKIIESL